MSKKTRCIILLVCLLFSGCRTAEQTPQPGKTEASYQPGLPYNPYTPPDNQDDFRNFDLSDRDLKESLDELLLLTFDTTTRWPPEEHLPEEFNPHHVLESGKDPGLGVRALHERGITGQGVGIAIVDSPLRLEHTEYKERIKHYEQIHIEPNERPEMHGSAVVSIAVGQSSGVAPGADLYYIASRTGDRDQNGDWTWNFDYYAQAVRRILEINQELPEDQKIRVIAMQIGFNAEMADLTEINLAIQEAREQGIFIICSTIEDIYGYKFQGLGRNPLADPEQFESYGPGSWWEEIFFTSEPTFDRLMFPMDSRTTAGPFHDDQYVFYREGGWSWVTPYIAGVYALAAQVDPEITPERFWSMALESGRYVEIVQQGKAYRLGPIIDPVKLIELSILASPAAQGGLSKTCPNFYAIMQIGYDQCLSAFNNDLQG